MNRYQILIEYDGTSRIGWQIQKKGESIQKILQNILSKILKEKIKISMDLEEQIKMFILLNNLHILILVQKY